jgi:hypothetical protein
VAQLKAKVLDNPQNPTLLEKGDGPVVSATPAAITIRPRLPCCDPFAIPGSYPHPLCWNHGIPRCCPNGKWVCPSNVEGDIYSCDGVTTTSGSFGSSCPIKCCDLPTNVLGSPNYCAYGAHCCYTGKWVCGAEDGSYICDDSGIKTIGETAHECPNPSLIDAGSDDGLVPTLASKPQAINIVDRASFVEEPDCSNVLCQAPTFLPCPIWQQITKPNECCPSCQLCQDGHTPLASYNCDIDECPKTYNCEAWTYVFGNGIKSIPICCPDCSKVLCPKPDCPVAQQFKPAGACCPLCKRSTCLDGSTPMPGNCPKLPCPSGYSCHGFLTSEFPGGPWFSYGLCCKGP